MKNFLIVLLVLIGLVSQSATYYINTTGSDTNDGLTAGTPWKTLAKVNAKTKIAGDNYLFNKGDTFYGTLTIGQAGSSGLPITFGAYGTGANPIISGFTTVSAWTNLGGNIWESTNAVSALTTCNIVLINGVNTPMGRFPKSGYYFYQSHSGNTSITSSNLTGTSNWTGAEVAFNSTRYECKRCPITAQSGSTITFTQPEAFSIDSYNGFRLIIQNDIRCCTQQNDWYFNPVTKKLSIYSTAQPADVKVSTIDDLVLNTQRNYIVFNNIKFTGANNSAFYLGSGDYDIIQNCQFENLGKDGIQGVYWDVAIGNNISNCSFSNINNNAIALCPYFSNAVISGNTISDIGLIYGSNAKITSGVTNGGIATGISAQGDGSIIENNTIENVGFIGIQYKGSNTTVQKNYVHKFCQNQHDGGGIYAWDGGNTTWSGTKVTQNIVINEVVNSDESDGLAAKYDACIYLDNYSNGIEISDNTCSGSTIGIFTTNSRNVSILRNVVFDNKYALRFYTLSGVVMSNITVTGNQFIAKYATQYCATMSEVEDIIPALTSDNNIWTRPIDDNVIFDLTRVNPSSATYNYTLAQWKTYSGKDANSTKSAVTITNSNDYFLVYNYTSTTKIVGLPSSMTDVNGSKYVTSISIPAYGSKLLIIDPNPAASTNPTGKKSVLKTGTKYYRNPVTGKFYVR